MSMDLFVVSVGKHFVYLDYLLKSVARFARGFRSLMVLVPETDMGAFGLIASQYNGPVPLQGVAFSEWPGQGMLHHMYQIMNSDQWSDADLICHLDSDCVFTEPVTPEDYLVEGRPVLLYAGFDWLDRQNPILRSWQKATEKAIGGPVPIEAMRRHPAVHWREIYGRARKQIEAHTGLGMVEFMRSQREEFPQSFCEFVTLGNVAWREMRDRYAWINQETEGTPPSKVHQAWSHRPPTDEDHAVYRKAGLE